MVIRRKHLNWLVVSFFVAIIAVVFQQIYTSMAEQGIATGGPYDNAAAYPRAITVLIGGVVVLQLLLSRLGPLNTEADNQIIAFAQLKRPAALLIIFGAYLGLLGYLGYHLTTAPMIFAIMVLCGMRVALSTIGTALIISFSFAYAFEVFLKVVLPGGIFGLNIPW